MSMNDKNHYNIVISLQLIKINENNNNNNNNKKESHGQMSLAGYNPWGRKESDITEAT